MCATLQMLLVDLRGKHLVSGSYGIVATAASLLLFCTVIAWKLRGQPVNLQYDLQHLVHDTRELHHGESRHRIFKPPHSSL